MRIFPSRGNVCFFHRPFQGSTVGSALYAAPAGSMAVLYRNRRIFAPGVVALGAVFPLGQTHVQKTAALAFATSPTAPSVPVPAAWHSQTITLNVRTHECDCENEQLSGERQFSFDGSGNLVQQILGTARLTLSQKRDAGGWLFQFVYLSSADGVQPTQFLLVCTAGPTSPATVTIPASSARQQSISIAGLQDAGAYTFKIQAAANSGGTTLDLLTGLTLTADASGPPAVSGLAAEEY